MYKDNLFTIFLPVTSHVQYLIDVIVPHTNRHLAEKSNEARQEIPLIEYLIIFIREIYIIPATKDSNCS
jgi:hypothetical protein